MKSLFVKTNLSFYLLLIIIMASCSTNKNIKKSDAKVKPHGRNSIKTNNEKSGISSTSKISDNKTLGIGLIIDSTTNLSRSFAAYELFKKNFIVNNHDTLYPIMIDYPFNTTYAITGIFCDQNAKFKFYKNGRKIKELISSKGWKDIYLKIGNELGIDGYKFKQKIVPINEGNSINMDEKNIENCFPGSTEIKIPYSRIIDTFRNYANIKYYYNNNPYISVKELFGNIGVNKENKLFFFRNDNVPYNLKDVAKPLVFPLFKSLTSSLTYLSCGKQFTVRNDYGAALNSYFSALICSNTVLASPFERALIRELTYEEISLVQKSISTNRINSSSLFKLGADLNKAYLESQIAQKQRLDYYEGISKIEDLCAKAESKAREIRGTKRLGGLLATISYVGALSSVSAYDNTASNALLEQSQVAFEQSFSQADEASTALEEQFKNIENQIETKSFISSDGIQLEIGKSFLAGEVYYYLSTQPEVVKNVLLSYSSDKPKLKGLIETFYEKKQFSNETLALNKIFLQMSEIEAKILNTEVRNIQLTEKLKSTF